ncbi:MAG: hypothetical protein JSV27_00010 [Candidatus Bathyarchaeota archaeon]|nr:MAG: hypothetical protein JSV27_00010 [Candidatus Bathyarchaeota archaeon]
MSGGMEVAKEALGGAIEAVRATSPEGAREMATRLQLAMNVLLENERKIWLRTKAGREMLGALGVAASRLAEIAGDGSPEEIEAALKEVELHAGEIREEIRRRSMVVT